MAVLPHGPACNPCQNDIVSQKNQQSGTLDHRVWSSGSLNNGDSNADQQMKPDPLLKESLSTRSLGSFCEGDNFLSDLAMLLS